MFPGGQAAYPSSVLMTVIPAKVAGVENIVVTVPTPDEANDMVLAALHLVALIRCLVLAVLRRLGQWPTAPRDRAE